LGGVALEVGNGSDVVLRLHGSSCGGLNLVSYLVLVKLSTSPDVLICEIWKANDRAENAL
jgi:hypothetical protein